MLGAAYGQLAMDAKDLSVSQRCALKMVQAPVAKKLKLTADQLAQFDKVKAEYAAASQKLNAEKSPPEDGIVANARHFANACLNILSQEQKHRILQVGIPGIGFFALLDPEIAAMVGLSADQLTKVTEICRAFAKDDEDVGAMIGRALAKVPEPKTAADRPAYDKTCRDIVKMYDGEHQRIEIERAKDDEAVLALMTPSQRAKWTDLTGSGSQK